jgi:hypothetical protein
VTVQSQSERPYAELDDDELSAKCREVRRQIDQLPARHSKRALLDRTLNELAAEYGRRARSSWEMNDV